ncbi:membrane-associated tyrosine- and threonine-specific cdc2-inhibitory kinase-like isoform X1 [Lycorma delicatula]|uniref:membrane-associated tyrosine- and threonine-specific cdc2-inhibitory kinase-like isoform X1 n=1 Tax=Lycorma delicatula TaxID=130591 RepID=UPI003F51148F
MLFDCRNILMSEQQPILSSSSQFNGSYLEESGIFLGTKQNQPVTHSLKPPRIISKTFNSSTPLYHLPRCIAGIEHFSGIFPSPLYSERCEQTYLNQCFDILYKVGEGSFGTVFKVRSKEDNNLYAVKVFKEPFRNRAHRASLLEEVRRHEQLSKHPNIVTLYQAWEDEGYLYILLELCETSLDLYTQAHHNISESMVWDILFDTLSAVKYIHDLNLIHMDIKLENILLANDGTFKLSDFGLVIDATRSSGNKEALEGDPKYLAPEVMNGKFTQAADIFSLGIAMLEVAGDLVLPGCGEAWHHLRQGKIPQQQTAKLSPELIEIIVGMMQPDPSLRLTAGIILKTPLLQRKRRLRRLRRVFKRIKNFSRRMLYLSMYPFRKLLVLWRKLKSIFLSKKNINKCTDSPITSPCLDVRYSGIGHSTPICNGDIDILNLSSISHSSFSFNNSNIKSRERSRMLGQKRLFAKRKLCYNFSDSE